MPTTSLWNPRFSVGHPLMDEQHRQLLAILQRAVDSLSDTSPQSREEAHIILNDLAVYVRTHFECEEALLQRCNYPGLAGQRADHLAYEARFNDMLYDATMGHIDAAELCSQLTAWWTHHVLQTDMQYRDYVQGRD